jgi:hypothetical protein
MFNGTRPIDWWMLAIEALVLILIAGEAGIGIRHWWKLRPPIKVVRKQISKGQHLRQSIPVHSHDENALWDWQNTVNAWSIETNETLAKFSIQAAAFFQLIVASSEVSPLVYGASGISFQLSGHSREAYQRLSIQLSNLRSIMEKPEAYF